MPLERHDFLEVQGDHIPGAINKITDYASRLAAPKENQAPRPGTLDGVRLSVETRDVEFALPGPGRRPELWGRSQEQEEAVAAAPRVGPPSERGLLQ